MRLPALLPLPPSLLLCLQDCMSLLLVYRRPMPRNMQDLGSWNTVLQIQVCGGHAGSPLGTWGSRQRLLLFVLLQQHTCFCSVFCFTQHSSAVQEARCFAAAV